MESIDYDSVSVKSIITSMNSYQNSLTEDDMEQQKMEDICKNIKKIYDHIIIPFTRGHLRFHNKHILNNVSYANFFAWFIKNMRK